MSRPLHQLSEGPSLPGRSTDELSNHPVSFADFSFSSSFSDPTPPTIASSTSKDDLSNGTSETPKLRVPVEVIERVLAYTFLRRTELTPSSDPYPLRNTTHLLLVSKAFRELCLPFFFRSIAITRSSDYVTFFGQFVGLFQGREGRRLWKFVKEICIAPDVHPPALFGNRERLPKRPHIPALDVPEIGRKRTSVQTICLLDGDSQGSNGDLEVFKRALEINGSQERSRIRMEYERALEEEWENWEAIDANGLEHWGKQTYGRSCDEEVERRIHNAVRDRLWNERREFYGRLFRPSHLVVSDHPSRLTQVTHMTASPPSPNIRRSAIYLHVHRHRHSNPAQGPVPTPDQSSSAVVVPQGPKVATAFATMSAFVSLSFIHLEGYSLEERPYCLDEMHEKEEGPMRWIFGRDGNTGDLVFVREVNIEPLLRHYPGFERLDEKLQLAWRGKSAEDVESTT